jgi:hypothetical protein
MKILQIVFFKTIFNVDFEFLGFLLLIYVL